MSIGRSNNSLYSSSMLDLIDNIVEVVVNSYFYWVDDFAFKQDLMQEGYLKAYELLKTGNYDPNQNLRNYLYTGVRNAMTNLNYHNNKEKHSSYDTYNDNVGVEYNQDFMVCTSDKFAQYQIDPDLIIKSCNKFNSNYIGNVFDYFNSIGISTPKVVNKIETPNPIVLKAIIVDIIWNI